MGEEENGGTDTQRGTETEMSQIRDFDDLRIYRASFDAAMQIFEYTKNWPPEERYALTDQIRRAARSVSANIAEAWRKRRYTKHFIAKLSDADAEAAEVRCWLDFAEACGYLSNERAESLKQTYNRIAGGLVRMMHQPEKWCGPSLLKEPDAPYTTE